MNCIVNIMRQPARPGIVYGGLLALILVLSATAPAGAAGRSGGQGGGNRDWHQHESRARGYWRGGSYNPYYPQVVYAPPVVYTPPEYSAPGISLIVPVHIR